MTKHIAIITIPNRMIVAGEYLGAYGHNVTHIARFEEHVTLPKSAASWTVPTEGNIEINIEYTGKTLGKRAMEAINRMIEQGFITEANIDGVELVEKSVSEEQAPVTEEITAEPVQEDEKAQEPEAYASPLARCGGCRKMVTDYQLGEDEILCVSCIREMAEFERIAELEARQQAWDKLQSVPSHVERYTTKSRQDLKASIDAMRAKVAKLTLV
jgi:hypothetical protein